MNLEVDPPLANCFRKLPAVIEHEPFFKIPPNISEIIPESIEHGGLLFQRIEDVPVSADRKVLKPTRHLPPIDGGKAIVSRFCLRGIVGKVKNCKVKLRKKRLCPSHVLTRSSRLAFSPVTISASYVRKVH